MRTIRFLFALTCLSLATATAQQRSPLQGFDAYVAKAMRDWRVPGLAIVVVKNDSVVFLKGYGVRELGKPEPVTVHTRFGNMSTTKAFTALLIAMLADSGRVSLDDPVQKHLPALQLADQYVSHEVTVRDLLTHRVGFGDPEYLWRSSGLDFGAIVPRLRFVRPTTSFRSRFQYNNVTYAIAGDVAAYASRKSWQELMHTRIYGPLGMSESYADSRELVAAQVTDVVSAHGIVRDTVRVLPVPINVIDGIPAAGAAFSTATDMGKWLRFLLDSGKVAGRRLVSAQNFSELFKPQQILARPFFPNATLLKPHFQAYGLGWLLQDYRGEFVVMHTGSVEGRTAIIGLLPERRLGVAIFTNLDRSELRHALLYAVFDRYMARQARPHDWSAEMRTFYRRIADSTAAARRAQESKRVLNTRPTLPLERYTGTYGDSLFGTAVIGLDGSQLTFEAGERIGRLEHWQHDVFRVNWADPYWPAEYVEFGVGDGSASELHFVDGEPRYRRR